MNTQVIGNTQDVPVIVSGFVSIGSDFSEDHSLSVYTVPFQSDLTIDINKKDLKMVSLRIFDLQGKKHYSHAGINASKITLDLSSLSSSVYFLELLLDNGLSEKRILVKH